VPTTRTASAPTTSGAPESGPLFSAEPPPPTPVVRPEPASPAPAQ
jgi:hypothetical protein